MFTILSKSGAGFGQKFGDFVKILSNCSRGSTSNIYKKEKKDQWSCSAAFINGPGGIKMGVDGVGSFKQHVVKFRKTL